MLTKEFETILRATQPELKTLVTNFLTKRGYEVTSADGFVYAKGNIPVMLVAHMDTVHHDPVHHICISKEGMVMSPQGIGGDDRCGVYMITEIIKKLKKKPYVVFTEDEETGGVGARKFVKSDIISSIDINYIIELDRKGKEDAVYYNCNNEDFEKWITSFGFKTAIGSYSDISTIAPALGVAAVNLSSGYYNQHTQHEYISLKTVNRVIGKVTEMISKKSVKYEYVAKYNYSSYGKGYSSYSGGYYSGWDRGYYDYDEDYGSKWSSRVTSGTNYEPTRRNVNIIDFDTSGFYIRDADSKFIITGNYCFDYSKKVYKYNPITKTITPLVGAILYNANGTPHTSPFNWQTAVMMNIKD